MDELEQRAIEHLKLHELRTSSDREMLVDFVRQEINAALERAAQIVDDADSGKILPAEGVAYAIRALKGTP